MRWSAAACRSSGDSGVGQSPLLLRASAYARSFHRGHRRPVADTVHTESFVPPETTSTGAGFTVELARSGRTVAVAPDQSILAALQAAGVPTTSSCKQGICGMCETVIVAGEAEHRDSLLTPEEQAANRTMMICCSRSRSDRLVLDL